MKLRERLKELDLVLLGATAGLIIVGFVVLSSATAPLGGSWTFLRSRFVHLVVGVAATMVVLSIDYRRLAGPWRLIYAGTLFMLLAVLVIGQTRLGAQRWIPLGPLGAFQPSEIAKVLLVLTLARHLDRPRLPESIPALIPVVAHAGVLMLLILKQPDMGTGMVMGAILAGMLFVSGIPFRTLGGMGALGLLGVPFLWSFLHDYQRKRLIVFLDPTVDPLGAGYALNQAKIAVGSGMLWGKGLFSGTQNLLRFIPEQHTDFVFTVVAEELGFMGGALVLTLFALWVWRGLRIAAGAPDRLGRLIAIGIVSMVVFHVFVNVGMTMGLMPITGIPLPFLSYGGSSLLTMCIATALLLNIAMRKYRLLLY